GAYSSYPGLFAIYNSRLFFTGGDLWFTDGTVAGTRDTFPAGAINKNPVSQTREMIVYNNALYFSANYDNNGQELWRYAENTAGIREIAGNVNDINVYPNPASGILNIENNT